jgi:diguanylate cyclase (GGDEF)-like protein
LAPMLEKYVFSGHAAIRRLSLEELFEFSIPVLTATDMNLLALTVLEKLGELVGATFGILFREQEESGTGGFAVVASSGFSDESMVAEFLLRFGGGVLHVSSPAPKVFPAEDISTLHPEDDQLLGDSRNFFILRFDLMPGVSIHAVLGLRNPLGPDVLGSVLLDFLLRQARFAFLNSERSVQTQNLIYIDDLTKLYNSRYLNVVLDRELKRSERYRNFFSVLFMDLDFFKRINDTHGHLVGSRVLIEIGSVLRSCVRETDTVVRYGGDEFVVVLVETNADEAFLVAERMRKLIEAKWFGQENGLNLHLTISIGIAAFPEHASTKQHLLNMADQAMYRGKESTRNVVYLADIQNVL